MPDRRTREAAGPCTDLEVIGAYAEGRLDAVAAEAVRSHLASCDTCLELVSEIVRTQDEVPDARPGDSQSPAAGSGGSAGDPVILPFRSRKLLALVGSVAVAAAAVLVMVVVEPGWWRRMWGPSDVPQIAALAAAASGQRTYEGRLTGGFPFAEFRTATRSGTPVSEQPLALMVAARAAEQEAQENPTPGNLHAWGLALLLTGHYDDSVSTLESARQLRPEEPRYLSDLGNAYLVRARVLSRAEDLARALEVLDRAIGLDSNLAEAVFTRACVLEQLGDRSAAIAGWESYLRLDPGSPWSDEARQRLARLRTASVPE